MANYYEILELSIDPQENDKGVIERQIETKNLYWSKNQHGGDGVVYAGYLASMDAIKRVMLEDQPPGERDRHAKEALNKQTERARNFIMGLKRPSGADGQFGITKTEVQSIEKATRLRQETIVGIAKKLAVSVSEGGGKSPAKSRPGDGDSILGKPRLTDMMAIPERQLEVVEKSDLYDFLSMGGNPDMSQLSPEDLCQSAVEKKKEFMRRDAVSSAGQKLCSLCLKVFATEADKLEYDRYLLYKSAMAVFSELNELVKIGGSQLQEDVCEDFIGRLVKVLRDRNLAEKEFHIYCISNGYRPASYIPPVKEYCPHCGCEIKAKDLSCPYCGRDICVKCPQCGELCRARTEYCTSCKFAFRSVNEAAELVKLARRYANRLDFDIAKAKLDKAESLWAKCPGLKQARDELCKLRQSVGNEIGRLHSAMEDGRYYEADSIFKRLRQKYPGFAVRDKQDRIDTAIRNARSCISAASAVSDENKSLELAAEAYRNCKDYPDIRRFVHKYPPKPVTSLKVTCDGIAGTNSLVWQTADGLAGLSFSIVRKKFSRPQNKLDGECIATVETKYYVDKTMEPSVQYFYGIVANRMAVESPIASHNDPAINLFELKDAAIHAGNGCIRISYAAPPPGATVQCWRSAGNAPAKPGAGQPVANPGSTGFTDAGLANDILYGYRLCTSYTAGAAQMVSPGIVLMATPICPPKTVLELSVAYLDKNAYKASWEPGISEEVRLYYSITPPVLEAGKIVPLPALQSMMQPLALSDRTESSAVFCLPDDRLYYILAVVVKNQSAVAGACSAARKLASARLATVEKSSAGIRVIVDTLKEASGYLLLYSSGAFANLPEDRTVTGRKYVPAATYMREGAILLEGLPPDEYCFSLFTAYNIGDERLYSNPSKLKWSDLPKKDLQYTVSARRVGIGKTALTIVIRSNLRSAVIPEIRVVANANSAPVFKNKGLLLGVIPPQQLDRSGVSYRMPVVGLSRNMYVKLFFEDDAVYEYFALKPEPGHNLKIS